ncbi:DNA-3-methyladenine glycosylase 2 family protein [Stieleria sp. JC731]|uniref:DNA-3-methyladenine glycosylase family protein n=1 Tax=Pirellulaceae TaxID=2691357 RepID=UPI001E2CF6F5|nr:DNA-3-methyladenine glycosylase 2 family protein [Stieleria sp. JC731]MCC9600400.1 DNA-3-methyladenine glycosylase 2 family protein [Stieleria sp. JC731]
MKNQQAASPMSSNDRRMIEKPTRLTKQSIADGAAELARRDPALRPILQRFGPPPLLKRPATFATLVHIILEQQVSVESAKSTNDRLAARCEGKVTPDRIAQLGEEGLRSLGFSRQKARYAVGLACDCIDGTFKPAAFPKLPDDQVRELIVQRKGLGNWSADVFMMMGLLRPDILPVGDLAFVKGLCEIDDCQYSDTDEIIERAELWRPLRSIATRMVWQWYVQQRGRDIF